MLNDKSLFMLQCEYCITSNTIFILSISLLPSLLAAVSLIALLKFPVFDEIIIKFPNYCN